MRLSLADLAKIILACSVAAACITPGHRAAEFSGVPAWGTLLVVDAIVVPLVWALFAFLFVRSGPRRVALVEALILGAVLVGLGFMVRGVATLAVPRVRQHGWRVIGVEELVVGLVVVGLAALALFLALRLARRVLVLRARRRSAG